MRRYTDSKLLFDTLSEIIEGGAKTALGEASDADFQNERRWASNASAMYVLRELGGCSLAL